MENRNYDLRVDICYEVPDISPSDGCKSPSRIRALLLYIIVGCGLVVSPFIASIAALIWPDIGDWTLNAITSFIYYPLACVLPVLLFVRKGGKSGFYAMRPNPLRAGTALLAAGLAVMGVLLANNLGALWALPFDAAGLDIYVSSMDAPQSIGQLLLAILTVGVLPGACEEMVFRGYIQPAFEEKGTKRAAIFVSLLFALLHGSVIGLPAQFVLGVIMAAIIIITDSIYASAIFHTVYNSALMILLYVQGQMGVGASEPGMLFRDIGGAIGVGSAVLGVAQMGAAVFFILFAMYRRAKRRGMRIVQKQPMRLRGGEIALLCVGLAIVMGFYLLDVLAMAGVVRV